MKTTAAWRAPFRKVPQPSIGLNRRSIRSRKVTLIEILPAGKLGKVAGDDRSHEQPYRTASDGATSGKPAPLCLPAHAGGQRPPALAGRGVEQRRRQDRAEAGPGADSERGGLEAGL